ncbi:MAG: GNAT family N-acetyltransferase [bacterium]|nr:GNAT family N-acetyltransferase [bacterium]
MERLEPERANRPPNQTPAFQGPSGRQSVRAGSGLSVSPTRDESKVAAMITVRAGKPADLTGLIALDAVARREPRRVDFIRRSIEQATCFVAEQHSATIGYGVLTHSFYGNAMIEMVYVGKRFRRSVVGSALVRFAESLAKTPKVFTSTNLSNKPMQLLLGRHGYVLTGYIDNLDEGDPELVYFRRLGDKQG